MVPAKKRNTAALKMRRALSPEILELNIDK